MFVNPNDVWEKNYEISYDEAYAKLSARGRAVLSTQKLYYTALPAYDPETLKRISGKYIKDRRTSAGKNLAFYSTKASNPGRSNIDIAVYSYIQSAGVGLAPSTLNVTNVSGANPFWSATRQGPTYGSYWEVIDLEKSRGYKTAIDILNAIGRDAAYVAHQRAQEYIDVSHFNDNVFAFIALGIGLVGSAAILLSPAIISTPIASAATPASALPTATVDTIGLSNQVALALGNTADIVPVGLTNVISSITGGAIEAVPIGLTQAVAVGTSIGGDVLLTSTGVSVSAPSLGIPALDTTTLGGIGGTAAALAKVAGDLIAPDQNEKPTAESPPEKPKSDNTLIEILGAIGIAILFFL